MPAAVNKPSVTATLREKGGWFGPTHQPRAMAHDPRIFSQADFDLFVATFRRTGFRPALAWYLNDAANIDFAGGAKDFGHLSLPVLFLDGAYDPVNGTLRSRSAVPMRLDCSNLGEARVASGHFLMREKKAEVCGLISDWLAASFGKMLPCCPSPKAEHRRPRSAVH